MANITSIGGNPIVPAAVQPNSVTNAMLKQTGGVLDMVACLRHDATIDEWVDSQGVFRSSENYARTDFIAFSGKAVFCDEIYNGNSSYTVAFFDANKELLGVYGNAVYDGYFYTENIPAGAAYVVASGKKSDNTNPLTPCIYCLDSPLEIAKEVERFNSDMHEVKNNHGTLTRAGYVNVTGYYNTTSNAKSTDYISLSGYSRFLTKTVMSASGCAIAFYDSEKEFMTDASIGGNGQGYSTYDVAIPAGASYAVTSYYDATGVFAGFEAYAYDDDTLESRVERIESVIPTGAAPQLLIFGDSITANMDITVNVTDVETTSYAARSYDNAYYDAGGNRITYSMWPRLIKSKISFSEVRNYAQSGASYKTRQRDSGNERQNLEFQVQLAINDASDPNEVFGKTLNPDMVIFALGTNDGAPNDTPSTAYAKRVYASDGDTVDVDATLAALDTSKFCEAAMWAFLRIKKQWPLAQGFVVLPIQRADGDTNGGDLHDYLEDIAGKFGYVVIDGYTDSGITRELNVWNDLGVHLKDGLHPNDKGQNMMARMIVAAINSHYVSFDGMNT